MPNVLIDKNKIDILANAIAAKSGEPLKLTLEEMVEAVDGIETDGGGVTPTGNIDITQAGVTDVTNYATATVPSGSTVGQLILPSTPNITVSSTGEIVVTHYAEDNIDPIYEGGWIEKGTLRQFVTYGDKNYQLPTQPATTITPTTSQQTAVTSGKYTTGNIVVDPMPSGTAGSPTATKGTVSNHSISVTPSVTNTTGYITGSTKTGTAVTVSASELVSGTKSITENGTSIDVTNYANVDVAVQSGMDVPIFTATYNQSTGVITVTCNKTYEQCEDLVFIDGKTTAVVDFGNGVYFPLEGFCEDGTKVQYFGTEQGVPSYEIVYNYNGTITFNDQSSVLDTLSVTENGTYTPPSGKVYNEVVVNVSGGGSDYELVGSAEFEVNTTSTSAITVGTITPTKVVRQTGAIIYVKIRDKAGKRAGHFYGSDQWFIDLFKANNSNTAITYEPRILYTINTNNKFDGTASSNYYISTTSAYGVIASKILSDGNITIQAKYSSNVSRQIKGTFVVEVYLLKWPNDISPLI